MCYWTTESVVLKKWIIQSTVYATGHTSVIFLREKKKKKKKKKEKEENISVYFSQKTYLFNG